MTRWEKLIGFADQIPTGIWVGLAMANIALTAVTWSVARRRMRRAGQRTTDTQPITGAARTKDTTLTVAAMVPAALFWAMVMAGSFHGLVAFGRDMLGWRDGWEFWIPTATQRAPASPTVAATARACSRVARASPNGSSCWAGGCGAVTAFLFH
jgi:hypothetical protein